MSVIAERPLTVSWNTGKLIYVMMEVRPAEMARIREKNPDLVGIPTYYSIEEDDVQWWPSCTEGWPVLGYDRP
jgi:hypothetical protein